MAVQRHCTSRIQRGPALSALSAGPTRRMRMTRFLRSAAFAALAFAVLPAVAAQAADPASCKAVKFSDVGWTDITATTAITARILEGLGYEPKIQVLSVPVTYTS